MCSVEIGIGSQEIKQFLLYKKDVNLPFCYFCTISLTWAVCVLKTSLIRLFVVEVPVPRQERAWSYTCVLRASIWPLSTIFQLDFRTAPTL